MKTFLAFGITCLFWPSAANAQVRIQPGKDGKPQRHRIEERVIIYH